MKKILVLGFCLFLTLGCSKGEEVNCTIKGKKAVFTLKNGIITSYVLNNENQAKTKIDDINGEYFTTSDNNDEGKLALKNYVESLGGDCE